MAAALVGAGSELGPVQERLTMSSGVPAKALTGGERSALPVTMRFGLE